MSGKSQWNAKVFEESSMHLLREQIEIKGGEKRWKGELIMSLMTNDLWRSKLR